MDDDFDLKKEIKNKIAIVLTLASIALLIVYAVDVSLERSDDGFLPFDAGARGFALGIPSVILPLIAFGITLKVSSRSLGILLLFNGILIVIGSTAFVSLQETAEPFDETVAMENLRSFAPVIGMGIFVIFLGIWKVIKS